MLNWSVCKMCLSRSTVHRLGFKRLGDMFRDFDCGQDYDDLLIMCPVEVLPFATGYDLEPYEYGRMFTARLGWSPPPLCPHAGRHTKSRSLLAKEVCVRCHNGHLDRVAADNSWGDREDVERRRWDALDDLFWDSLGIVTKCHAQYGRRLSIVYGFPRPIDRVPNGCPYVVEHTVSINEAGEVDM